MGTRALRDGPLLIEDDLHSVYLAEKEWLFANAREAVSVSLPEAAEAAAEAALRDFPEPKQLAWTQFNTPKERKLAFDVVEKLPAAARDVLYFLNSRPMLQFLEDLTGIQGVVSDPYYVGGGLHQIKPGGNLEVHADFNYHEKLKLDRRINVLIYLNKDWKEEYGGHFELWNRDMTRAEQKILPLFNRCAIFSTTSYSYHGHPTPLACPPERTR